MNSFFRLIDTEKYFFSFLASGFCPKNLAFAGKNMVLPNSGRAAAAPPPVSFSPSGTPMARGGEFAPERL